MVLCCGTLEGIGTDADMQKAIQSQTDDFQVCDMQCIDESQCSDVGQQRTQVYNKSEEFVSFCEKESMRTEKRLARKWYDSRPKGAEGSSGIKSGRGPRKKGMKGRGLRGESLE